MKQGVKSPLSLCLRLPVRCTQTGAARVCTGRLIPDPHELIRKGEKMEESKNRTGLPSIHIQAVIAVLFINFIHKLVREIPGSLNLEGGIGGIVTTTTALILALSIILLLYRKRQGLVLGMVPAVWAMLQWVLVHVIKGHPDQNGIWWYPIFPIVQGALIIYFSVLAWRNDKSFK